jgi:hypothetical protein
MFGCAELGVRPHRRRPPTTNHRRLKPTRSREPASTAPLRLVRVLPAQHQDGPLGGDGNMREPRPQGRGFSRFSSGSRWPRLLDLGHDRARRLIVAAGLVTARDVAGRHEHGEARANDAHPLFAVARQPATCRTRCDVVRLGSHLRILPHRTTRVCDGCGTRTYQAVAAWASCAGSECSPCCWARPAS